MEKRPLEHASTPWRSLDELEDTPEFRRFLEREFPAEDPEKPPKVARRRFLQLMGASVALAGASGCRWEEDRLLPFAERPEGWIPGKPRHYATTMELSGVGQGLLVTSYDGRPIKVEGNPKHPFSRGATDVFAQAAILDLYDPERSRFPERIEGGRRVRAGWKEFHEFYWPMRSALRGNGGEGLAVLCRPSSSPARAALRETFRRALPRAIFAEYEPLNRDAVFAGAKEAFGRPLEFHFDLSKADTILCLDCDLLRAEPGSLGYARDFADRRAPEGGRPNRLYVVESTMSLTGAAADHRLALRSEQIGPFLMALEGLVSGKSGAEAGIRGFLAEGKAKRFVEALARELGTAKGRGLVAVGSRQPSWVHALAHRLNGRLGNHGSTVHFRVPEVETDQTASLGALVSAMASGAVKTCFVLDGNPVYDAPADMDFGAAYAKVETRVHLAYSLDETSLASTWHLPMAHFLESWGDARAADGTWCLQQPLIKPLFESRSVLETLAYLPEGRWPDAKKLVRDAFDRGPGASGADWRLSLRDGVVKGSRAGLGVPKLSPKTGGANAAPSAWESRARGVELVFDADPKVHDGRFANNGWLQELPDFISKLTWDNAAFLAPRTAERMGVSQGDVLRIGAGGRSLEIAAYILPGQAEDSIFLPLGYGRKEAGVVGGSEARGIPSPGFDTYALRTSAAMGFAEGAEVVKTGATHVLACTQDHFAIDEIGREGRAEKVHDLVRGGTLEEYRKDPEFARHQSHVPPLESLWEEHEYEGRRWGMTIDLGRCTGCNACVVGCQAENNIPIVGKEQVLEGREMQWLRIDRYFKGDPEDPEVVQQPMTCQQCELAPCEQVCPVAATTHSEEGLNDMVYNRCVGTRYCANNCPFKVRRFNYFNFNKKLDYDPDYRIARLGKNPEVTIRHRGVMEKCTFCVQRIHAARIPAKNEGRPIRDGEVVTACQQACPTGAIVFGDLADEGSRVAASFSSDRSYQTLAELNIKPRIAYLARIRNPNPELG